MPNAIKGDAPLKLKDGRSFTLRLDFEGLIAAETSYGKPLSQLMADAAAEYMGAIRALLHGALHAHHADLTQEQATSILFANMPEVAKALQTASQTAMPDDGGDDDDLNGNQDSAGEGEQSARPTGSGNASLANGAKPAATRKRSGGKRRVPTR